MSSRGSSCTTWIIFHNWTKLWRCAAEVMFWRARIQLAPTISLATCSKSPVGHACSNYRRRVDKHNRISAARVFLCIYKNYWWFACLSGDILSPFRRRWNHRRLKCISVWWRKENSLYTKHVQAHSFGSVVVIFLYFTFLPWENPASYDSCIFYYWLW